MSKRQRLVNSGRSTRCRRQLTNNSKYAVQAVARVMPFEKRRKAKAHECTHKMAADCGWWVMYRCTTKVELGGGGRGRKKEKAEAEIS